MYLQPLLSASSGHASHAEMKVDAVGEERYDGRATAANKRQYAKTRRERLMVVVEPGRQRQYQRR